MEIDRELTALAAEIEWPPTPPLRPELPARRRALRRPLLLAIALGLVALAAAFAVPRSRGAILRFLHLGAATVELVDRLPPARERPLAAGLGPAVPPAAARRLLGGALLLPPLSPSPPLHASGVTVSLLFLDQGEPVLLSELDTGDAAVLKKVAASGTRVAWLQVGPDPGVWLSGARHVVLFPGAPARLAGDVLLWQHGRLTLRLEGRNLTESRALELALALR